MRNNVLVLADTRGYRLASSVVRPSSGFNKSVHRRLIQGNITSTLITALVPIRLPEECN